MSIFGKLDFVAMLFSIYKFPVKPKTNLSFVDGRFSIYFFKTRENISLFLIYLQPSFTRIRKYRPRSNSPFGL